MDTGIEKDGNLGITAQRAIITRNPDISEPLSQNLDESLNLLYKNFCLRCSNERLASEKAKNVSNYPRKEILSKHEDEDWTCFDFNVWDKKYKILALNPDKSPIYYNVLNDPSRKYMIPDLLKLENFLTKKQEENKKWHVLKTNEYMDLLISLWDIVNFEYLEDDTILFSYLTNLKWRCMVKNKDWKYLVFDCEPNMIFWASFYEGVGNNGHKMLSGTLLLAVIE